MTCGGRCVPRVWRARPPFPSILGEVRRARSRVSPPPVSLVLAREKGVCECLGVGGSMCWGVLSGPSWSVCVAGWCGFRRLCGGGEVGLQVGCHSGWHPSELGSKPSASRPGGAVVRMA